MSLAHPIIVPFALECYVVVITPCNETTHCMLTNPLFVKVLWVIGNTYNY